MFEYSAGKSLLIDESPAFLYLTMAVSLFLVSGAGEKTIAVKKGAI